MKIHLIRFSQDFDIDTKSMLNFLVFQREDGSVFRVPTQDDTLAAILEEIEGGSVAGEEEEDVRDERHSPTYAETPRVMTLVDEYEDEPGLSEEATEFGEEFVPEIPPEGGVRGQIELTPEELAEAGIEPSELPARAPPVNPRRVLRRPQRTVQRSLVPGDDGVPGL